MEGKQQQSMKNQQYNYEQEKQEGKQHRTSRFLTQHRACNNNRKLIGKKKVNNKAHGRLKKTEHGTASA